MTIPELDTSFIPNSGMSQNLVGMVFGSLSVVELGRKDRYSNQWWVCMCSCGNSVSVLGFRLKNGAITSCPTCRPEVVGKRFGKVTVLEILGVGTDFGKKHRGYIVSGLCDCGNPWEGSLDSLRRGNTKSCGCMPTGPIPRSSNIEDPSLLRVLSNYQRHSQRRGYSWELTNEQFLTLLNGDCYYCGQPPSNVSQPNKKRERLCPRRVVRKTTYSGIDRKDNSLGYTPMNTISCCSWCNYAKRDLSVQDFLDHIRRVYLRQWQE